MRRWDSAIWHTKMIFLDRSKSQQPKILPLQLKLQPQIRSLLIKLQPKIHTRIKQVWNQTKFKSNVSKEHIQTFVLFIYWKHILMAILIIYNINYTSTWIYDRQDTNLDEMTIVNFWHLCRLEFSQPSSKIDKFTLLQSKLRSFSSTVLKLMPPKIFFRLIAAKSITRKPKKGEFLLLKIAGKVFAPKKFSNLLCLRKWITSEMNHLRNGSLRKMCYFGIDYFEKVSLSKWLTLETSEFPGLTSVEIFQKAGYRSGPNWTFLNRSQNLQKSPSSFSFNLPLNSDPFSKWPFFPEVTVNIRSQNIASS